MYPLYIYFQGANKVCFTGEGETVVQGCKYSPGTGKVSMSEHGEVIEEIIDVRFESATGDIESKLFEIEKYLEIAGQETIAKDWVYLRFCDESNYDWASRLLGGKIEYLECGLVDRDFESQRAKITIRRLNYWEGSRRAAPCFDAGDAEPGHQHNIQDLYGHTDGGHKSWFGICGHDAECDIPTPLELYFSNPYSADQYNDITISERVLKGTGRAEAGWVEGESMAQGSGASSKTVNADATCSDGNAAAFAWNSTSEIQLATYVFSSATLAILRGQVQRGLMRLRTVNAATDIWIRLKILDAAGSNVLAESIWMLAPASVKYLELPPIQIPSGLTNFDLYQQVMIGLYVKKVSGGATSFDIDFIDFVPAETIRRLKFKNVGHTVGLEGYYLIDSGIDEETYYQDADGTKKITHVGTGNYPMIYPGYDSVIEYNHQAGGAGTWGLYVRTVVLPFYKPRRRNI